jgi:hypothetical protein
MPIRLCVTQRHRSVGTTLLVAFFAAGALICVVTMLALAFPGGFLEPIWRLKPEARIEFRAIGRTSVVLMAVVRIACGPAAVGLAKNAEWGRRLAIGVLSANLVGDSLNAFLRHDPKTLIGLPIGGLMIWYLLRKIPAKVGAIDPIARLGLLLGSEDSRNSKRCLHFGRHDKKSALISST